MIGTTLSEMAVLKPNSWLSRRIITRIETITPSCEDMTHLLSQSMDRRLLLHKRLAIWLHLTICNRCKRFAEHLAFIRKASRPMLDYTEYILPTSLPESAEERIKEYIRRARHGRSDQCTTFVTGIHSARCLPCKDSKTFPTD